MSARESCSSLEIYSLTLFMALFRRVWKGVFLEHSAIRRSNSILSSLKGLQKAASDTSLKKSRSFEESVFVLSIHELYTSHTMDVKWILIGVALVHNVLQPRNNLIDLI